MKPRWLLPALCLVVTSPTLLAESRQERAARRQLQSIYRELAQAMVTKRFQPIFADHLAPSFVYFDESGASLARRQFVKDALTMDDSWRFASATFAVEKLDLRGKRAIARVKGHIRGMALGEPFDQTKQSKDTWLRTRSGWQMLSSVQLGDGEEPVPDTALALKEVCRLPNCSPVAKAEWSPADDSFTLLESDGSLTMRSPSGTVMKRVKMPMEQVSAFTQSQDGKRILAGMQSGKVCVHDLSTGTWQTAFEKPGQEVTHVAWLHGTNRAIMGMGLPWEQLKEKPAGYVFDLSDGKVISSFSSGMYSRYRNLRVSRDGRRVVVAEIPGKPRGAYLIDPDRGEPIAAYTEGAGILSVGIDPQGTTVAGSNPADVILWDAQSERRIRTLKGHTNWVVCLEFSPDGRRLVSGSGDGTARVWNVSTGREIGRIRFTPNDYVWSVGFSHDGKLVLAAAESGKLVVARAPSLPH